MTIKELIEQENELGVSDGKLVPEQIREFIDRTIKSFAYFDEEKKKV